MGRYIATAALIALLVAACGDADTAAPVPSAATTTTTSSPPVIDEDDLGELPAPIQSEGEFALDRQAPLVTGRLELAADGCWTVVINGTERLVVFPNGFSTRDDDATLIFGSDGTPFTPGMDVDGAAHLLHESMLPGGSDGRWGNYVALCAPSLAELAVFDRVEPAFDPTTLTPSRIEQLARSAVFTEAWPCGRGWATSTADQRVGLMIYQADDRRPEPGQAIELPHAGWTAEIIVGKHQFVQHCDDAIEEWEPQPVTVARWALQGGTIEILDPVPASDEPPAEVHATLTNAWVQLDAGRLQLPDLDLVNTAFNLFAG